MTGSLAEVLRGILSGAPGMYAVSALPPRSECADRPVKRTRGARATSGGGPAARFLRDCAHRVGKRAGHCVLWRMPHCVLCDMCAVLCDTCWVVLCCVCVVACGMYLHLVRFPVLLR